MKKKMIFSLAMLLSAATFTYAQTTSGSEGQSSSQNKQNKGTSQAAEQNKDSQAAQPVAANKTKSSKPAADQPAGAKSGNPGTSARPGGAEHKNANDVGRYSESDKSKSMLNSKEALAKRKKNLTEADTTVKSGSGSAEKNTKNLTGKTGNYKNEQSKHDNGRN